MFVLFIKDRSVEKKTLDNKSFRQANKVLLKRIGCNGIR